MLKKTKKLITALLAMTMGISSFSSLSVLAGTGVENPIEEVLYYNEFDTGSNEDLKETAHTDFYYPGYNAAFKTAVNNYEYASSNAPANYYVNMRELSEAEFEGNKGIRLAQSIGVGNGPVVLFDFRYRDAEKTPSRTPGGLRSGKYTMSFDFSVQGDVYDASGETRILANCFHGNSASNLAHFGNKTWSILPGSNSWTYTSFRNMELNPDLAYSYDMVLDLDNHKVQHYLNGEFVGEITGYKKTIKFLMIVMNGDLDYFDNLKLTKEIAYPVEYDITSDKTGNNFYGDEAMSFTVTATNREDADLVENVVIKAANPCGGEEKVLLEKELTLYGNSSTSFDFSPALNEYGSWNLSVESERSRLVTTRVARVVEVDELNPEVAICFHMDGRHGACDIHEGFELMEHAGISAARTDYGISVQTEEITNEAGETIKVPTGYSGPSGTWYENVIKESEEHGIDILPILYLTRHGCYGTDADGGYNTTDEALGVVYEAAKKFAESTKGHFKWFELGNEDNYYWKPATQDSTIISLSNKKAILNRGYIYETPGTYNAKYPAENYTITVEDSLVTVVKNATGEVIYDKVLAYEPEDGADYAKVLKAGYDGIKAANPDAVVMNSGSSVVYIDDGGTIRNQYEFASGLLGAIQADSENKYYDVFAVHSYHSGSAPEAGDQWKRYMDFTEQQDVLTDLLEQYGQISKNAETGEIEKDVERWATEIGYSSSAAEERHYAAWMTRLMALNFMGDEYGPYHDKYFIYALFNHGFDKAADSENTYGIVNNWADEYWYKKSAYAVKEPYLAVAQWNKMMNGLKYNEAGSYINHTSDNKYSGGDEVLTAGLFNLEFSNEAERVNIVWDASGNNEATTVAADKLKKITVYDMYGNVESETYASSVDITATEEPVYVEFKEAELFEITSLKITADTDGTEADGITLSSASKVYAEVKYKNLSLKERVFNLVAGVYDGERLIKVISEEIKLAPSDSTEESVKYLEIPLDKASRLSVKAFVLEDFDSLKPLCESVEAKECDQTVLYYNTFPTGTADDLPEVEHELYYFYGRNAKLKNALNVTREYVHDATTCTAVTRNYNMGLDELQTSEFNGDKGVRVGSNCSIGAGPVVMLDFRYSDADKTPTTDGTLKSGVYKLGFDFVLDGEVSKSDGFRVEANCMHGNCGNSFAWCMDTTWHNLSGGNTWSYTEQDIPITNDELHRYEVIFDLDNDKVITYMDGERRKDTAFSKNINFLHITIGGKLKYIDNIEFNKMNF